MEYHSEQLKEILKNLKTNRNGLTQKSAKSRLKKFGKNEITKKTKHNYLILFLKQFTDFLSILLIIAAIISYSISLLPNSQSHLTDVILIISIIIINGIFKFIQSYKAEKSIEALNKIKTFYTRIIRDKTIKNIDSRNLVPGDIIILKQGDIVPADARIIETNNLLVDESMLTGESRSIEKKAAILKKETQTTERTNILYKGTLINSGRCTAVIFATGNHTELGRIAKTITSAKERKNKFTEEIKQVGKRISLIILSIISIIFIINMILTNISITETIITSIALAVAAIPEGLPAIVTITLAFGTRVILKRNSLVRKLHSIETLGAVNIICTDKTGTLTENKMTVTKIYTNKIIDVKKEKNKLRFFHKNKKIQEKNISKLLECGVRCNDSVYGQDEKGNYSYIGEPTETALVNLVDKSILKFPQSKRIDEIQFSSIRKYMATLNNKTIYLKGAPRIILDKCKYIYENNKKIKLTTKKRKEILKANKNFGSEAMRVLGFAFKETKEKSLKEKSLKDMVFLGLQAMTDPPKEKVKESLKLCKKAGIRVVMITGDNISTAKAIANEVGLKSKKSIEGKDIDKLSHKNFIKIINKTNIFARVSPEHKVKILKALQSSGAIVAMTGDGINDSPALKNSDVGIAMGKRGSDIAKETADIIILDDNFSTIVESVRMGRGIYDNIKNFINYLLSSNFAEVFSVFIASLFSYNPLAAVHLLWINLLTDGFPAVALGMDKPRKNIMDDKPRKKNSSIINKEMLFSIIIIGSLMTTIAMGSFFIAKAIFDYEKAKTILFTILVLGAFIRITTIRLTRDIPIFSNSTLMIAISLSVIAHLVIMYSKFALFFKIVPLGIKEWILTIIALIIGLFMAIIISWIRNKYKSKK